MGGGVGRAVGRLEEEVEEAGDGMALGSGTARSGRIDIGRRIVPHHDAGPSQEGQVAQGQLGPDVGIDGGGGGAVPPITRQVLSIGSIVIRRRRRLSSLLIIAAIDGQKAKGSIQIGTEPAGEQI